jgi:hypothetical protein
MRNPPTAPPFFYISKHITTANGFIIKFINACSIFVFFCFYMPIFSLSVAYSTSLFFSALMAAFAPIAGLDA